jgi:hypothetical protein
MLDTERTMAKLKTYLMEQQEQHMNDEEIETYLELLHEEWLAKHEAYRYEDNPNPNDTNKGANNVRCSDG